jgi:hypothetical protein
MTLARYRLCQFGPSVARLSSCGRPPVQATTTRESAPLHALHAPAAPSPPALRCRWMHASQFARMSCPWCTLLARRTQRTGQGSTHRLGPFAALAASSPCSWLHVANTTSHILCFVLRLYFGPTAADE